MAKVTIKLILSTVLLAAGCTPDSNSDIASKSTSQTHVYEVVEQSLTAQITYDNPYLDVDLWVDLDGPDDLHYRIPAFWDGGQTFRVRLVATKPGKWHWSTGSSTGDTGLDNQKGTFEAIAWTDKEKQENPNRRGFIRVAKNQHTLEYADGTPYFNTADTWWCTLTKVYSWDSDAGLSGISFQDALALRKAQGFNSVNLIACFPSDTMNGIWDKSSHGEKVAEDGSLPFEIADPSDKDFGVDYTRINPRYWQQADRKWQHMWNNGFAPFMESVRRHEKWYDENPREREAFVNYTRYLWARYGCYNMIYSWVHWDWDPKVLPQWKAMVNMAHDALGEMPYGQPRTAMAWGSSLTTWLLEPGAVSADALDIHNVSNKGRDYQMQGWLRDIYNAKPTKPGANVEPFYPGWQNKLKEGLGETAMAQFQMYGSVLNGGFAGHAWGDLYYAGVATNPREGVVVPAGEPHVKGFNRYGARTMGILKDFVLDKGHDYRTLIPATLTHHEDNERELCVLALNKDKSVGLGFIAEGKDKRDIIGLPANVDYTIEWWNVDEGGWSAVGKLTTGATGKLVLPDPPNKNGWAYRIKRSN
ncbi:MAG: DUF4038 domain-containing protein [Puniceicoccaceae bacterium]